MAVQMAAFARALPEPLTEEEGRIFDAFYARRAYLGGLPLVILHARFPFLREAILDLLDDPVDPLRVGALLLLMEYYATMASARRVADRAAKQRASARPNPSAKGRGRRPKAPSGAGRRHLLFCSIAEEFRKAFGVDCPCGPLADWSASFPEGDTNADPIVLQFDCASCDRSERREAGRAEFIEVSRRLQSQTQHV
ncbi:hypothetical protein [Paludisphaera mucosa]|uniref:Uncharacterized protein n=1 Tax=Paludisphaera mucosa TaxID=3030827 RepID=A0ABT6FE26_9BACT|nr:hypothetical protein [Paludisphaera mucosa]MDG3005836.1 hypothetical protein [Paludisphaera mucosa]